MKRLIGLNMSVIPMTWAEQKNKNQIILYFTKDTD